MAKAYMGKTGTVLFSIAVAIFALLNAISTFTVYGKSRHRYPVSVSMAKLRCTL
jgi:hypothetical protein